MTNKQQDAINKLLAELGKTLRQKAMMEFEENNEFYPPNNGREEGSRYNEMTAETMTQEEAREWIDQRVVEYIEEMTPTLIQTAMDF